MKANFLFLLGISWIFIAATCDEGCDDNPSGVYEFVIAATVSPNTATISVGDTLTITSRLSKELYDRVTGNTYFFETFPYSASTQLAKVDENPADHDVLDNFEFIVDPAYDYSSMTGGEGKTILNGKYLTLGDNYEITFQLVAQTAGLYVLTQGVDLQLPEASFPGRCTNATSYAIMDINGDAENNIELLMDSPDPFFNERVFANPDLQFYDQGRFAFKVE